ncbi:hypothetical protein AVEN_194267-1 [Araneus ventricosus]|uniref:Uncharacterized protein n=1 Tax=Araneus ventricosus TaxID=182803 RepID=A0A4Y2G3J5_ARAVE|nr:hypothetical protein AVEN_194267-1 [Araneus ventricosus]
MSLSCPANLMVRREFYWSTYEMPSAAFHKCLSPDLGDKTEIFKNARIFAISVIGAEIRISPEISIVTPCQEDYKYAAVRIDWEVFGVRSPLKNHFGVSSAVRAGKPVS